MKKAELMEYGIPESKIRAFNDVYWNDVRKQAARMVEEAKGQEAAPFPAALREAIESMLRLIPDPARLSSILSNVNRHYQSYQNERNGVKENAQKPPVTVQKGASECP